MFSVDHQAEFKVKKPANALYTFSKKGPHFGMNGGCLHAELSGTNQCGSHVEDNNDTFGDLRDNEGNSILTGTKYKFTALDIEVFSVL